MGLLSIRFFKNALTAVRAAEVLHKAGMASTVVPAFKLAVRAQVAPACEPVLRAAGFPPMLTTHSGFDFDYLGPRVRNGMTFNVVDPAHSLLLANLLDQSAILADMGSMFVNGSPASHLFGGLAKSLREMAAADHGPSDETNNTALAR